MSELQDPRQQDPELEELERRLSAAFGGTRPRRGFQDELWARIERRRGPRLASWRLRTWSALGALAAILVIGLGVLAVPRLASSSPAGVAKQAQTSASAPQTPGRAADGSAGAARPQQAETAGEAFGPLPAPVLVPPATPAAAPGQPQPYYGPAHLTVSAKLPAMPATLHVYRYRQPAPGDLDGFAAQLGASRAGAAGTATIYRAADFQLDLLPAAAGREPRFGVGSVAGPAAGPGGADSRQAADGFLAAHPPLKPDWPNAVQVGAGAQGQKVFYLREFELSAAQPGQLAAQVDGAGSPAGLSVDVAGGSVTGATGPLPLALESSDYRSRTAQQATADALAAPQGTGPRPADIPSIQLSKVSLVYIAAGTDQYGYFLPAYLFTGTITTRGQTLEKRVLVPAVS